MNTKESIKETGHKYIADGFPVLFLHSVNPDKTCTCGQQSCIEKGGQGKHPATPNGLKDAATTIEDFDSQLEKLRFVPNLGIRADGLYIMDVDPRHGGQQSLLKLQSLLPDNCLMYSRIVLTGGGGYHFYFGLPLYPAGTLAQGANVIAPGVDARVNGKGYVVAPPSNHLSGGNYSIKQDVKIGGMNPQLEKLILLAQKVRKIHRVKELIDAGISDGRNVALTSIAGHLINYKFKGEELLDALQYCNVLGCTPQLDSYEVEVIARSAENFTAKTEDYKLSAQTTPAPNIPQLIFAADMVEDAGLEFLIDGLLAKKYPSIIVGESKVGKTILAITIAQYLSQGKEVFGRKPLAPCKVVYVVGEMGKEFFYKRLQDMGMKDDKSIALLFTSEFPNGFDIQKNEDDICELAKDADLIILDSFFAVSDSDTSKGQEVKPALKSIQRIARKTNSHVMIVHHLRKGNGAVKRTEPDFDDIQGSVEFSKVVSDMFLVYSHDKPSRLNRVKWSGWGDFPSMFEYRISSEAGVLDAVFNFDVGADTYKSNAQAVRDAIRTFDSFGFTVHDINLQLGQMDRDVDDKTIYNVLTKMAKDGYLRSTQEKGSKTKRFFNQ